MGFWLGFIGTFLGIIIAFIVIVLCIMGFIDKMFGRDTVKKLIGFVKISKDLKRQEYGRVKSVSGMTKVLEPGILEAFPDFNKNLLFNIIEKNLNNIFRAIEDKNVEVLKKDEDLILLKDSVSEYIKDIKSRGVEIDYSDVKFHAHAIKSYEKNSGMATITTSSSVEYFYKNSENENSYDDVKKQTRYTCKFVYIYDESKINTEREVFIISCPNCGAPVRGLGNISCDYCSSHVEPINLRAWKMSYYKEDYEE